MEVSLTIKSHIFSRVKAEIIVLLKEFEKDDEDLMDFIIKTKYDDENVKNFVFPCELGERRRTDEELRSQFLNLAIKLFSTHLVYPEATETDAPGKAQAKDDIETVEVEDSSYEEVPGVSEPSKAIETETGHNAGVFNCVN